MKYILLTLFLIAALAAPAQGPRVSVGFWNVENLFDTIPNPLTGDGDFTPGGKYGWNTQRYTQKIKDIARVLDEMSLDVAGLAEVENEGVVRDLVRALKTDYAYIHLQGDDPRGIEQAILYKGDKFFPDERGARLVHPAAGRGFLHVRGKLAGYPVDLVVVHLPSALSSEEHRRAAMASLRRFTDSLLKAGGCPVVMGDMNAAPGERLMREELGVQRQPGRGTPFLHAPFARLAVQGAGSYVYDDRWLLYDNIFIARELLSAPGLRLCDAGVFIREWMLSDGAGVRRGYPRRTFSGGAYTGGASDHLPVFVTLTY